jgi:hypothetical protein
MMRHAPDANWQKFVGRGQVLYFQLPRRLSKATINKQDQGY